MEYPPIIRGKGCMDGARTLGEAADRLRKQADLLDEMSADGVELLDIVEDDYGVLFRL